MKDVTLPSELANPKLTLEEIGSIFVLYSLLSIKEGDRNIWVGDENYLKVIAGLINKKIIDFLKNDLDQDIVEIDISKLS